MMEFTTYEIAYRLNVSEETVRRWIRTGQLKADDTSGKYLVKEEDLQAFLNRRSSRTGKAVSWLASIGGAGVRAAAPGVALQLPILQRLLRCQGLNYIKYCLVLKL